MLIASWLPRLSTAPSCSLTVQKRLSSSMRLTTMIATVTRSSASSMKLRLGRRQTSRRNYLSLLNVSISRLLSPIQMVNTFPPSCLSYLIWPFFALSSLFSISIKFMKILSTAYRSPRFAMSGSLLMSPRARVSSMT